jgi:hypothetical protein
MSTIRTTEHDPAATADQPTPRSRRVARGVAVVAALATLSAGMVALDAGPASALPPGQCSYFQSWISGDEALARHWDDQFTIDYYAPDWSQLSNDRTNYNNAERDLSFAVVSARSAGC